MINSRGVLLCVVFFFSQTQRYMSMRKKKQLRENINTRNHDKREREKKRIIK
jgi:hypothetical protein